LAAAEGEVLVLGAAVPLPAFAAAEDEDADDAGRGGCRRG
jgi:hypothetical protein